MRVKLTIVIFFIIVFPGSTLAMDTLKIFTPQSKNDPRSNYDAELFELVMKAAEPKFGPYQIVQTLRNASQDRDLVEVISGEIANADIVAARKEWEDQTIPIRIPLLKNMLGTRLFLIRKDMSDIFSGIKQLERLKSLAAGSGRTWTITRVFEKQGFNVVKGTSYDGLFKMLSTQRFDYFPRGLNEVFLEYEIRKDELPDVIIEPTIALQLPLPTFFFVSPRYQRLAQRLEYGLKKTQIDGSFDTLFYKHFGDLYKKANLPKRRIFKVENPMLTPETIRALK